MIYWGEEVVIISAWKSVRSLIITGMFQRLTQKTISTIRTLDVNEL